MIDSLPLRSFPPDLFVLQTNRYLVLLVRVRLSLTYLVVQHSQSSIFIRFFICQRLDTPLSQLVDLTMQSSQPHLQIEDALFMILVELVLGKSLGIREDYTNLLEKQKR